MKKKKEKTTKEKCPHTWLLYDEDVGDYVCIKCGKRPRCEGDEKT